jgi:hypothetical protein
MANPGYITGDTAILADGEAWIALNSTTLTSDTAYITFTSGYNDAGQDVGGVQAWDQYMDLVMICYVRAASAANSRTCYLSLNGSSTNADYDIQQFKGNGSSATAPTSESHVLFPLLIANNSTANAFSVAVAQFFDINSGKWKSWLVQSASEFVTEGDVCLSAGTFLKQDPLTSIKVWPSSGDLKDESRIDLFGILPSMLSVGTVA